MVSHLQQRPQRTALLKVEPGEERSTSLLAKL
jgi:hypothetical protein